MGLVNKGMTVLHFDETYKLQPKLQIFPHESIDFYDLQHVNLYCEQDSLTKIEHRLAERRKKGMTLIGSGNYHYVTASLLKEIKEPFTLVLFDHHPDIGFSDESGTLLSCGSWVSYALKHIPLLKKAVIIGPTSLKNQRTALPNATIFPYNSHRTSSKMILSAIPTNTVYISIDKDVLKKTDAATNWDQGQMSLASLLHYLQELLQHKNVYGMDICGEAKLSPDHFFDLSFRDALRKNESANIKILQTCLKGASQLKGA
ncbi:MAG: arginase family protein [Bacillales bacterium]|nr:arginase family protein [Bacillales bacterium]